MTEAKRVRMFSIVASVCFLLVAVYDLWCLMSWFTNWNNAYITIMVPLTMRFTVCEALPLIAIAVLLFIGNKNIIFFIPISILIIGIFIYRIMYLVDFSFSNAMISLLSTLKSDVAIILAYIGLLIIAVLSTGKKALKLPIVISIIPSILYLTHCIHLLISNIQNDTDIKIIIREVALGALLVIGLLMISLWYRIAPAFKPKMNKQKTQIVTHNDLIGGADCIRKYKELLDSGIITQEEFEEKKKQLLGQ